MKVKTQLKAGADTRNTLGGYEVGYQDGQRDARESIKSRMETWCPDCRLNL